MMNGICIPCLVDFCVQFVYDEQKCGDDQVKDTSYAVDEQKFTCWSSFPHKFGGDAFSKVSYFNNQFLALLFVFLEFFFLLFSNPSSCSRQLD